MAERQNRTQASFSLQEELTLRTEKEKRSLEEQLSMLRASQQATESKARGLQVRFLVQSSCQPVISGGFFVLFQSHLLCFQSSQNDRDYVCPVSTFSCSHQRKLNLMSFQSCSSIVSHHYSFHVAASPLSMLRAAKQYICIIYLFLSVLSVCFVTLDHSIFRMGRKKC